MSDREVLVEVSTALSDIVTLLEARDDAKKADDPILVDISAKLTALAAALATREPPTVVAAAPVVIPPAQVSVTIPQLNGWNFSFEVKADKDGLIKTIEGKARRPPK